MRGPQTYINGSPDRGEQARPSLQGSRTLFVFTLSTRAFDSPWLSAASMPARWSRIERASCTNAGSRQRQAHVSSSSAWMHHATFDLVWLGVLILTPGVGVPAGPVCPAFPLRFRLGLSAGGRVRPVGV